MDAYYRNDYPKAVSCFHKLFPLKSDGKFKREYLRKVEEACKTIVSEMREERDSKSIGKARSIAEQIKRML